MKDIKYKCISVASMTYAQKAVELLKNKGIDSYIIKQTVKKPHRFTVYHIACRNFVKQLAHVICALNGLQARISVLPVRHGREGKGDKFDPLISIPVRLIRIARGDIKSIPRANGQHGIL